MHLSEEQAIRLQKEFNSLIIHPQYLKNVAMKLGANFLYESDAVVRMKPAKIDNAISYQMRGTTQLTIKHLDLFLVYCEVDILRFYQFGFKTTIQVRIPITHLLLETLKEAGLKRF